MSIKIKETEYFEMLYGNIDEIIEKLNKMKEDGWTEIETYDEYTCLKIKYRDENEEERNKRLRKEESERKAKAAEKEKRRRQYELLKKEFGE